MKASKKAVVISNCQCLPLAAALTLFSADTSFEFFGVHIIPVDQRQQKFEHFVEKSRQEYDFILSISLGAEFGVLLET